MQIIAFLFVFVLFAKQSYSQETVALQKLKTYASENKARLGLSPADISTLIVSKEYTDPTTGIHHIYGTQKLNGLVIVNSNFSLHTVGEKNFEASQLVPTNSYAIKPASAAINSSDAIKILMTAVDYRGEKIFELKQAPQGTDLTTIYKRTTSPMWDIPARLVYYNNEKLKILQPAWEVQMMDLYKKHYWLAYIDASSGKIIEHRDLILHCDFGGGETDANPTNHSLHKHRFEESTAKSTERYKGIFDNKAITTNSYRVYDMPLESPGDTIQQLAPHIISNVSGNEVASPDGWHRTNAGAIINQYTKGNNVYAFQDPSPGPLGGVPDPTPIRTAYNNGGLAGAPAVIEPFVFDYPINLADDPTVYQKAAIVNLFYWNNLMHDVFYNLGFTEAAGNFQELHVFSNGTRTGGVPGDFVLAQAQDGGGTNNANFFTPPDGTSGQMQMYLWTGSFPDFIVQIVSSVPTGNPPAGTKYLAIQGSFGTAPTANTNLFTNPVLDREFVVVKRNNLSTVGTESEGCSTGTINATVPANVALPPGNDVQDKIVLIDRGNCSFSEKVLGAQAGGAAAVIVINNVDGPPIAMGGADATGNAIRIPAVMVSKADGDALKAAIAAGTLVRGSLTRNTPPQPKRDGDLDNGVIAHEYGHGISTRMSGGLGGSEQGGEGWSDFMAIYMTLRSNDLVTDPSFPNKKLPTRSIGNYVTYQQAEGRGIRPTPYSIDRSVNPSSFKDIGKGGEISIPHGVGYIWCTMLYEMMQKFINVYGMGDNVYEGAAPTADKNPPAAAKGNNIAMRLILEGIKIQGSSPTFERQRDAILRADTALYNGKHACMIWEAFASRGLGASAKSNTNGVGDEVEAFDMPLTCNPNQKRIGIVKSGPVKLTNGTPATYTLTVTNKYPVNTNGITVVDTLPAGLTFVSATDGGVFNTTTNAVVWTIDLAANASKTLTLVTNVNTLASSTLKFGDDHEISAAKWTVANTGGLDTWTYTTNASMAFSGSKYWFIPDTDLGGSNSNLRTNTAINVPANGELVFIHKYSTEAAYDGGVVETSTDGLNWTYIPPIKFVRGGYNGIIPTTNNPGIGTANLAAFTGTSPGYIVSIAKLDNLVGQNIFVRFRFTTDATGGSVDGGGWWLDDVYVLSDRTEIGNTAIALTTIGEAIRESEGSNARSTSSAFVLSPVALPSAISTLSANLTKQSSVDLSWITYNQTGSETYEIERKGGADANFVSVGAITNTTTSQSSKKYTFNDANVVSGNRYQYRVKQVNRNGEFIYTNIALVTIGSKVFTASVYPNPANTVANISIINPSGSKVTINLFDVLGNKIATFIAAEARSQVVPLPVQGLSAGTYWVEVSTLTDERTTLRLVINK